MKPAYLILGVFTVSIFSDLFLLFFQFWPLLLNSDFAEEVFIYLVIQ